MLTRLHITLIIGLAVVIWVIALLARGAPITADHAWPFGLTVTIVTIAALVFERWVWKWKLFKSWLVKRPNLQGTWKVELRSDWQDPETGTRRAPIQCIMTIRQTYSTLSLRLFTNESSSFLFSHEIIQQNDGVFQIAGVYQNNPDIHLRGDRSEMHYGALFLEVQGDPPESLSGHYWTDRSTKGSLNLTDRNETLVANYQQGAEMFGIGD